MSKILTVFGATGNQGGSVIRAVLQDATLSKEFKIRAVTRNVEKPAAKLLAEKGVELVSADMSSQEAAAPAVKGSHTVFLVTNFWETMSMDTEMAQGKAVTDACKDAGVQHIIFSSLVNTTEVSQGRLPHISHFVGKSKIEDHIRQSGIPCTFVLLGLFMTNFFESIQKSEDGTYTLALPISGETGKIPLVDAASDMGKFVKIALKHHPELAGKRIYGTPGYVTPSQLVSDFSEAMGAPAKYVQIPGETFKSFLPPPVAEEMLENFLLLDDAGYYGDVDLSETLRLLEDKPVSWKDFVIANKQKWI